MPRREVLGPLLVLALQGEGASPLALAESSLTEKRTDLVLATAGLSPTAMTGAVEQDVSDKAVAAISQGGDCVCKAIPPRHIRLGTAEQVARVGELSTTVEPSPSIVSSRNPALSADSERCDSVSVSRAIQQRQEEVLVITCPVRRADRGCDTGMD